MKFDLLHNFISPVTGRHLADEDYVLVGDNQGIATPSPILIDIRLDLIQFRKDYNALVKGDFIIGHPNEQVPDAQVLVTKSDGFLYNTEGIVSTTNDIPAGSLVLPQGQVFVGDVTNHAAPSQIIDITNLPNLGTSSNPIYLGKGQIWRGTSEGRPVVSNDLSSLENSVTLIQLDILGIKGDILTIQGQLVIIDAQLTALEASVAVLTLAIVDVNARINALRLNNIPVDGDVTIGDYKLINVGDPTDPTDGVNLRTLQSYVINNGGAKYITGFVIGGPPVNGVIDVVRGFTDLDMLGYRVTNLKQSPEEDFDAISTTFLWDLMHDEVDILWQ